MHESSWPDLQHTGDECGSHTTLNAVYADQAADYIDRVFAPYVRSPGPTPGPTDPSPSSGEPASLMDDLRDMGWFEG
jgi:hypothetical protein